MWITTLKIWFLKKEHVYFFSANTGNTVKHAHNKIMPVVKLYIIFTHEKKITEILFFIKKFGYNELFLADPEGS